MASSVTAVPKAPSLQELCAKKLHKCIDDEMTEHFRLNPALKANQYEEDSLFSLTTIATVAREFFKTSSIPVSGASKGVPCPLLTMIAHPFLVAEWQKETKETNYCTEKAWQVIYEAESKDWPECWRAAGYPPPGDPGDDLLWEQRYYKIRFARLMFHSGGNFSKVSPVDLAFFYRYRNRVRALSFDHNASMNDRNLQMVARLFSEATEWHLSSCCGIKEKGFKELVTSHSKMEVLDLSLNGWDVTSEVVRALARSCNSLRELNLWAIDPALDPKVLLAVAKANPHLQTLTIGNYRDLSNPDLVKMLSYCKELRHLTLRDMKNLDVATLEQILLALPHLQNLTIIRCKELKAEDAEKLSGNYPVQSLIVRECPRLTTDRLSQIVERFSKLRTFSWSPYVE